MLAGTSGIVDWHMGWIWAKLAFVLGLTVFHFLLARWRSDDAAASAVECGLGIG